MPRARSLPSPVAATSPGPAGQSQAVRVAPVGVESPWLGLREERTLRPGAAVPGLPRWRRWRLLPLSTLLLSLNLSLSTNSPAQRPGPDQWETRPRPATQRPLLPPLNARTLPDFAESGRGSRVTGTLPPLPHTPQTRHRTEPGGPSRLLDRRGNRGSETLIRDLKPVRGWTTGDPGSSSVSSVTVSCVTPGNGTFIAIIQFPF